MYQPLTFFTNPMSRGRIVRWMLEETGAAYDTRVLEYGGSMKAAEYLAINPLGKVPALRHGERVVTEVPAICAYLADAFPAAGLAPPLDQRADYYRWLFFAAGPLESALTNQALGVEVPAERRGMVGYAPVATLLDVLAGAVSAGEYIAGPRFSAADVYVGSHLGFGLRFGTIPARPAFDAYLARLTAREAYVRAAALDDALMPAK